MESQSDDVPAAERWDWWREKVHQTLGPVAMQRYQDTDFRFTGRRLRLGEVQVTELGHPSVRFHRSTRLIRQQDPEQLLLNLNLRGHTSAVITGREGHAHRTGDFMLSDTSRPSYTWMSGDDGSYLHVLVQVPRTVVPLPPNAVDRLLTLPLPGREGIGALLSNYLTGLVSNGHQFKPADVARLSTTTVDLLTALFAHHLDATASTPYETQQRVLQICIRDFIQQHLGDPQLSPTIIAAAHGISTRYLHKLFHDQDVTVAGLIRQRRLERCRRDLADPHLRSRPVHAIAARWGFTDAAHFSRLFRVAYDMPPGDYRRLVRESNNVRGSSSTVRPQSMIS